MKNFKLIILFLLLLLILKCSSVEDISLKNEFDASTELLKQDLDSIKQILKLPNGTRIESAVIDSASKTISVSFNKNLAVIPLREQNVNEIYSSVKNYFASAFEDYNYKVFCIGYPIENLIPSYYQKDKSKIDSSKFSKNKSERIPVVQNTSRGFKISNGLFGSNILLWHSHGWYYNYTEKRWMWQRARLFQTVEDLGPASFTIPYLIPMLENAGANIFVPRERDLQLNEVIVDNDSPNKESYHEKIFSEKGFWKTTLQPGFALKKSTIKEGENPFKEGTSRYTRSMINPLANVAWLPDIPQSGKYAVYISYSSSDSNVTDAHYNVIHSGGVTEFLVNQTIGGGTWIYLGSFKFDKGNKESQGVTLTNQSKDENKIISADAVRFGGGVGIIEREGITSGRPKYVEGSRYWLQYAGMPDTLIYNLSNNLDDYKDDYQSRAEYGNYLYGSPFGPNLNREEKGLGIPLDLSLAFHTDAGITRNDTAIGTLMIYCIVDADSQVVFPDGVSRLVNRDLSDIVMTQLVDDIRLKYDSAWTRRQLMNASYSEAARPNIPSMLLELLSHQNFYEMKFAHDPRFRFDVSRSIYKGMLKFLAVQNGFEYVVQPLPSTDFSVQLKRNGEVELNWRPQIDSTEQTAITDKYILYTRENDGGFDNGKIVETNKLILKDLKPGVIYSYKVTAINGGGESFPSEILSACWMNNSKEPVLIVNGFDRISAPASFNSPTYSGFLNYKDEGVPDKYELGFTGEQFNFNPDSKWMSDDNPGHGASHSNFESKVISGNTFDFTYLHGKALKENDFSFGSVSDETIMNGNIELSNYKMIDFIFGEEKKTESPKYNNQLSFEVFPILLREKISKYLNGGGKIFMSGTYIGTDLYSDIDSSGIKFANEVLKLKLKTGHAVKTGKLFAINNFLNGLNGNLEFNTTFNDSIYKVEAPDELGEVKGSEVLLRYSENNFSAAVGYKDNYSIISFGFPFETIIGDKQRTLLMKSVLNYLEVK